MPALINEERIRIGELGLMDESCGTEFSPEMKLLRQLLRAN
jgi:hypothetical protein